MAMGIDLQDARLFMRTRLANRDAPPPRLLAAVSGGLDSMCLLRFLLDWQAENGGTVIAAHFNHRLRGETADRDEEFVRNWCRENCIPFHA
ncbi:MAG: tRNA(Ile)-lysidine synthetase, partial [Oscillibacter sp.]|nr:tRNA(Ile)-lysidine synthetase [Oscillibacter sp.]